MAEQGSVWKYLPGIIGLLIGLMIFNPPGFLHRFGGASYLLMVLFAVFAVFAFSVIIIHKNLPTDLTIRRSTNTALPGEMTKLSEDFKSLGFVQASEVPLIFGIAPPAVVIPFVNEPERIYGAIYKTDTMPPRISFDMVSIFEGDRGGLTTGVLAEGAAMPTRGSLKQVLLRANVSTVYEKHRQAINYLKGKGILCKAVNPQSFEKEMRASIIRLRKSFLASPLIFTLTVIWRAATKKTPHLGPIQNQDGAQQQIQQIVAGKTHL
jgi:hypothetical protein